MKLLERDASTEEASTADKSGADLLRALVQHSAAHGESMTGVIVGELVGIRDEPHSPLVVYPGQRGSAALEARSVVDLTGAHIGKQVLLMFERGNPSRPLIMGILRDHSGAARALPGLVEIDVDGARVIITGKDQLVLRCGHASVTLTRAGKVLIKGTFVESSSSGVSRIKGGSVQIN